MSYNLKPEQRNQENEYWFPYHYVSRFENNNFKHFYLDTWAINYASTIEFLLKKIIPKHNSRIIDIGCGDGRLTRELAFAYRHSLVTGIDFSKRAIAMAKAMNHDISNIEFKVLDVTNNSTLGEFDIAVLMEVFEHIPLEDCNMFIKGVHNLLRDKGVLYLTVPHQNKATEYKHFQHFSIETITSYLLPYFDVVEVVPFERIAWTRKLILNVLSNKWFILRNSTLLSSIYQWYKNHLFYCINESECQRVYVKAVAK